MNAMWGKRIRHWRGAVAAAALLMVALPLSGCEKSQSAEAPDTVRPVRVSVVHLEPAVATETYSAVIRPRVEADLGFRVAGKVIARLVNVGDRVEAGTPLARLDPNDLDLALKASMAALAAAQSDQVNTRDDFDRATRLREGGWTTKQEFEARRTAMEKAEAQVRQAQSDVNVKQNQMQYATLLADGPGVVTGTSIEPGQVVAAGQTVVQVARLGELEAVANIPENRVDGFGARALSVELWAFPGRPIQGVLRELAPSADAATRTFQAKITLKAPPPGVQIGMTATVQAKAPAAGLIARLPLAAITQNGTDPAVWVVKPDTGQLELRPVTIAAYAGDQVVIAGGLDEGWPVVNAGVHKLDAGQRVRIWTEGTR